jgi:hormone-sensitive lipase
MFKSKEKMPKAVIFHIHGGGFISMSSFIHQTYTRKWANDLNVPIISVDYGKAPDRPFP